jgi:hypothetical protein
MSSLNMICMNKRTARFRLIFRFAVAAFVPVNPAIAAASDNF